VAGIGVVGGLLGEVGVLRGRHFGNNVRISTSDPSLSSNESFMALGCQRKRERKYVKHLWLISTHILKDSIERTEIK